jgi:hypothetical protein
MASIILKIDSHTLRPLSELVMITQPDLRFMLKREVHRKPLPLLPLWQTHPPFSCDAITHPKERRERSSAFSGPTCNVVIFSTVSAFSEWLAD